MDENSNKVMVGKLLKQYYFQQMNLNYLLIRHNANILFSNIRNSVLDFLQVLKDDTRYISRNTFNINNKININVAKQLRDFRNEYSKNHKIYIIRSERESSTNIISNESNNHKKKQDMICELITKTGKKLNTTNIPDTINHDTEYTIDENDMEKILNESIIFTQ